MTKKEALLEIAEISCEREGVYVISQNDQVVLGILEKLIDTERKSLLEEVKKRLLDLNMKAHGEKLRAWNTVSDDIIDVLTSLEEE